MIKHLWSIYCKKSLVDATTNNISLFEEIEELNININVPSNLKDVVINIPIESELVSLWYREDEKQEYAFDTKITLINPKNIEPKGFENKIAFPEGKRRLRTIIKINGIGITDTGIYILKLGKKEVNEKEYTTVFEYPIDIRVNKSIATGIPLETINNVNSN